MAQIINELQGHFSQRQIINQALAHQKVPHALIFVGPQSIGKKKMALALAQALICERRVDQLEQACGECPSCLRVFKQQSENLKLIVPEGTQIKIDQVRDVLHFLSLASFHQRRVIIFDQAHTMNPQAANALLKTLEEPADDVFFILLVPEVNLLMPTIRSRSQVIRFFPLQHDEVKKIRPQAESWMLVSSRGQIEKVDQFLKSDFIEKRQTGLQLFQQFWLDPEFLLAEEWRDLVKEKGQAQFIVQSWLSLVRDWLLYDLNEQKFLINADQKNLFEELKIFSKDVVADFFVGLVQAEKDLLGYAEPVLIFESLWVRYARQNN